MKSNVLILLYTTTVLYIQIGNSTTCKKPHSFFDFDLPVSNLPYSGKLSLFGDGITGGEVNVEGELDMTIANGAPAGSRAQITFSSINLSGLNFVFENELFEPFEIDNSDPDCTSCQIRSRLPPMDLPVCPFKINLLQLLDGDDTNASGNAVLYIAKSLNDTIELGAGKSEESIISYGTAISNVPEKVCTFSDMKNNNQIRQALTNLTNFNAKNVTVVKGIEISNEVLLTEANSSGQNTFVFISDGFTDDLINPAELEAAIKQLYTIPNIRVICISVDGDTNILRKILRCKKNEHCRNLIILSDVSRASADIAVAEARKIICTPPPLKEQKMIDANTATLLTFSVKDKENLSKPSLQSVADAIIRETSHELNVPQSNFEVLEARTMSPNDLQATSLSSSSSSIGRKLSLVDNIPSTGILKIGMLNENLNSQPGDIAQTIGQKLSESTSGLSTNLRKQTGALVSLENFEIKPLQSAGSLREGIASKLPFGNALPLNSDALNISENFNGGILSNISGFF